jgi:hypothetical protein
VQGEGRLVESCGARAGRGILGVRLCADGRLAAGPVVPAETLGTLVAIGRAENVSGCTRQG